MTDAELDALERDLANDHALICDRVGAPSPDLLKTNASNAIDALRALRAERDAALAGAVTVKPLVWSEIYDRTYIAETRYGRFACGVDYEGLAYYQTPSHEHDSSSLDDARSAADAAWQDMVRADFSELLTPDPSRDDRIARDRQMAAEGVRMAAALPPYDCDGDPAGQFDNKVFVKRDAIRALAARVEKGEA